MMTHFRFPLKLSDHKSPKRALHSSFAFHRINAAALSSHLRARKQMRIRPVGAMPTMQIINFQYRCSVTRHQRALRNVHLSTRPAPRRALRQAGCAPRTTNRGILIQTIGDTVTSSPRLPAPQACGMSWAEFRTAPLAEAAPLTCAGDKRCFRPLVINNNLQTDCPIAM